MPVDAPRLDFVQAAHELFRRRSAWHRHGAMIRGLYVGMSGQELRAFMLEAGDTDDVRDVEAMMAGGEPFQTERPACGFISTYHLSLWQLIEHDPFTIDLADHNPLGNHLAWPPQ